MSSNVIIPSLTIPNQLLVSGGINPQWTTNKVYSIDDLVLKDSYLVKCITAHTSGTYATDVRTGKWQMAYPMMNYFLNSALDINQRSFTSPSALSGTQTYYFDRWTCQLNNDPVSITNVSPIGSKGTSAIKLTRTSGTTNGSKAIVAQAFETKDIIKLRGKTLTLSFNCKIGADFSGSINVALFVGTGAEGKRGLAGVYTGETAPINATVSGVTTTAARFAMISTTIPLTATQMEIHVYGQWSALSGADDSFTVDEIMLNEGPAPAAFQTAGENIQSELAMCQRYYEKVGLVNNCVLGIGHAQLNNRYDLYYQWLVQKRVIPTTITFGTAASDFTLDHGGGTHTATGMASVAPTVSGMGIQVTAGAVFTVGQGGQLRTATANGYISAEAEL